jgi:hypothetical protein
MAIKPKIDTYWAFDGQQNLSNLHTMLYTFPFLIKGNALAQQ